MNRKLFTLRSASALCIVFLVLILRDEFYLPGLYLFWAGAVGCHIVVVIWPWKRQLFCAGFSLSGPLISAVPFVLKIVHDYPARIESTPMTPWLGAGFVLGEIFCVVLALSILISEPEAERRAFIGGLAAATSVSSFLMLIGMAENGRGALPPSRMAPEVVMSFLSKSLEENAKVRGNGTYPESWDKFASPYWIGGDSHLIAGKTWDFDVIYNPVWRDGKSVGYRLVADGRSWWHGGSWSYFIDQSHKFHEHVGQRLAAETDPIPPKTSLVFESIRRCINAKGVENLSDYNLRTYPEDLGPMKTPGGICGLEGDLNAAMTQFTHGGYRFRYEGTYEFPYRERLHGFVLRARPRVYGETGVRSYYTHETSDPGVHVTSFDREARTTDPTLMHCEYEAPPDCKIGP